MERKTVIQLKSMAKERGLKGYSKLRKAELINMLSALVAKPTPSTSSASANSEVVDPQANKVVTAIGTYVKPTLERVKQAYNWSNTKAADLSGFINKNLDDLIDWAKKPSMTKPAPMLKKAFEWTKSKTPDLTGFISKNLNDLVTWAKKPSKTVPKFSDCQRRTRRENI